MIMTEESQSLGTALESADSQRNAIEALRDTNEPNYQDRLRATIAQYQQCLQVADSVALFSPNESLDDISTSDLR